MSTRGTINAREQIALVTQRVSSTRQSDGHPQISKRGPDRSRHEQAPFQRCVTALPSLVVNRQPADDLAATATRQNCYRERIEGSARL